MVSRAARPRRFVRFERGTDGLLEMLGGVHAGLSADLALISDLITTRTKIRMCVIACGLVGSGGCHLPGWIAVYVMHAPRDCSDLRP